MGCQQVQEEYVVRVHKAKAYRARQIAQDMIEGTYKQQYAALWDYAKELKVSNIGSTVEFICDHGPDGTPIFKRLYICYVGCKSGFNAGCRKLIGLDGCHIKGPHFGHMSTAIGIDVINSMFPITFAVVESKYRDSQPTSLWFLDYLKEDVNIHNPHH